MSHLSATSSSSSRPKKCRLKKWELIPVPSIDLLKEISESDLSKRLLEPGFCIRFFQQNMLFLYTVASHRVLITRGVLDYLHDFNQLGPNKGRNKIFLCSQFARSKKCLNGSLCREVHCILSIDDARDANSYGVSSNATGAPNIIEIVDEEVLRRQIERLNPEQILIEDVSSSFESSASSPGLDSTVVRMIDTYILRHSLHSRWSTKSMYPTLPPGVPFQVALPNTPTPVDEYDSGELFATKGAQEYYDHLVQNKLSPLSMQHCAHFTKNGLCCFGEDCAFVHVVHQRQRERLDGSSSDADTISGADFSANIDLGRRLKKKGQISKETPLSIDDARALNETMMYNNISNMSGIQPVSTLAINPTSLTSQALPIDSRWYIPPHSKGKSMPMVMTSMPMPQQNYSNPHKLSNQFVMMPGAPYVPMHGGNGATQPVYVFQPVYVQTNTQQ